jgi:hypothetical protein
MPASACGRPACGACLQGVPSRQTSSPHPRSAAADSEVLQRRSGSRLGKEVLDSLQTSPCSPVLLGGAFRALPAAAGALNTRTHLLCEMRRGHAGQTSTYTQHPCHSCNLQRPPSLPPLFVRQQVKPLSVRGRNSATRMKCNITNPTSQATPKVCPVIAC